MDKTPLRSAVMRQAAVQKDKQQPGPLHARATIATRFERPEALPKVVERAKGILQKQKGIKWDITSMPAGNGRYYVYVKVGPKTARWDSSWYKGSWTFVDKQDFSRAKNSYDLPEDVRSVLFNLSVILPSVGKDVPIRFQVWDEKGNEEHLRLKP